MEMMNNLRPNHLHCECPQCHSRFRPPLFLLFFSFHIGFKVFLVCPNCGYRGLMTVKCD